MLNKLHKKAIAIAAAGALALGLGGSMVSSAIALPKNTASTTATTAVDMDREGVIHVVKYDDGSHAKAANGASDQGMPNGANPIEGIEFNLTPVKVAVIGSQTITVKELLASHDAEKLKELAKFTPEQIAKICDEETSGWGCNRSSGVKKNTDAKGQIDFTVDSLGQPLKPDLYLLRETNSTAKNGKTYRKAPPSLIFLPMTKPDGTGWITEDPADPSSKYAVWVYPKNSLEDNLKTVVDKDKKVGDQITYQIAATVPAVKELSSEEKGALNNGRTYDLNSFGLWDNLDQKLQLTRADSVSVKYGDDAATAHALNVNDDYVVKLYEDTVPTADPRTNAGTDAVAASTKTGQKLVVALTAAGLQKVADAKFNNAATNVFFSFTPTVKQSGVIPNEAKLYKNHGKTKGITEVDTPVVPFDTPNADNTLDTNVVVSAWGKLTITKKDDKGNTLPGAKFKLYGKTTADSNFDFGQGKELTVQGKSEFVTDEHGVVTIDGLHATNLENSNTNVEGYTKYALVETEAPAGYELDREPREFTIDVATELDKVTAEASWKIDEHGVVTPVDTEAKLKAEYAASTPVEIPGITVSHVVGSSEISAAAVPEASLVRTVEVLNIKVKPRLPLTGGAGIAIFGVLGAGLLLGGLYAARRRS